MQSFVIASEVGPVLRARITCGAKRAGSTRSIKQFGLNAETIESARARALEVGGERRPIDDSAEPIRDGEGAFNSAPSERRTRVASGIRGLSGGDYLGSLFALKRGATQRARS